MSISFENKRGNKDQPVNLIGEMFQRFFPYWPVFILALVVCISLAYLKLRYSTPMYKATASIMLKDEESGVESVISALEGTVSKKNVENEIEILKSIKLMSEVAKDIGLYAQVFMPGTVRHIYAYKSSPVSFIAVEPETINSTDLISFTFLPQEHSIEMNGVKYHLGDSVNTPFGRFILVENENSNIMDNRQFMVQFVKVNDISKSLLSNLVIYPGSKQSTVLNLALTDPVPDRAADILNKLIALYNKAAIDDKNTMAANTLEFIENRLGLITVELSSIEGEIETFKSQEGVVDITSEGASFLSSVQSSDQALSEVKIQLSVLDQVERYVVNKSDMPGTVPATLGISDPILMRLLNQLNEAELQLSKLKRTGAENSPAVLTLQGQIAQLKPSILENIRNLKQNLQTTEYKLQGESNKYSSLLRSIPRKERKLLDIRRQQDVKNNIYTFLLEKREETALSYASAAADSRLINEAESSSFPVSPVKTSIYLFAIAIAVLLGIGFVLLKENYTRFVMFRSEIEKATDVPILTEIAQNKIKNELIVIGDNKRSPIAEQFRSLRTSVGFIGTNTGNSNKTILLTSSISGDGKSFIAINLAVSLAITNKKVLLLDLDLRKPKIAGMLDLKTDLGISNFLAGSTSIDKIVCKMKEFPNLNVITAGSIPPNPTELLLNGKLEKLIETFKSEFDYIILDSPPLGLVTDAKLLQVYSDINLYVIRHNHTPKKFLGYVQQLAASSELKNMYIVFNGVKERGILGTSKKSGYGNGYGYGYGYEETDKQVGFWSKSKPKSKTGKDVLEKK